MAEYVQVLKRALKHIGGHGGARGAILQLLRVNDLKTGNLIGIDKYGNKYYEDKRNFFGRHRWVVYTDEMNGKNTFWEVDGSMVPPEWHRWLHSMTDEPPTTHPPVARKFIWENHKFNAQVSTGKCLLPGVDSCWGCQESQLWHLLHLTHPPPAFSLVFR